MSICHAEAAKDVLVGREEVLKQEIGVEGKEELEQKSCLGWKSDFGAFCFLLPSSC